MLVNQWPLEPKSYRSIFWSLSWSIRASLRRHPLSRKVLMEYFFTHFYSKTHIPCNFFRYFLIFSWYPIRARSDSTLFHFSLLHFIGNPMNEPVTRLWDFSWCLKTVLCTFQSVENQPHVIQGRYGWRKISKNQHHKILRRCASLNDTLSVPLPHFGRQGLLFYIRSSSNSMLPKPIF